MRFDLTPLPKPKVGDTRKLTKFLILPKTIGYDMRWWETATFMQVSKRRKVNEYEWVTYWEDTEWVDKPDSSKELDSLLEEVGMRRRKDT